jgi:Tol biopolymer transport system component
MKATTIPLVVVAVILLAGTPARRARATFGPISQISLGLGGEQPNSDSTTPAVSADGSVVVFLSLADNLVESDSNGVADVFVVDRLAGTTTRVVGPEGEFPFDSESALVSDDGRIIAFVNDGRLWVLDRDGGVAQEVADLINQPYALSGNGRFLLIAGEDEQQLVPGDENGAIDIFLFDRTTRGFERISRGLAGAEPNGSSVSPAVTPDGRYVAFFSAADNLVQGDGIQDRLYVHDRTLNITEVASGLGVGEEGLFDTAIAPAISNDGRVVSYIAYDAERVAGIYVRDRLAATTMRLPVSGMTTPPDISANSPLTMSGDGRRFVFGLLADFFEDVYIFDRDAMSTFLVSTASGGGSADGDSIAGRLSNNGRAIVFASNAANLVPSGPDGLTMNVFLAARSASVCQVGDVNGDGEVDAADIPALIELIFGDNQ